MPIWLRRFVFNEIKETKEKEAEEINKMKTPGASKGVSHPSFNIPKTPKLTYKKK